MLVLGYTEISYVTKSASYANLSITAAEFLASPKCLHKVCCGALCYERAGSGMKQTEVCHGQRPNKKCIAFPRQYSARSYHTKYKIPFTRVYYLIVVYILVVIFSSTSISRDAAALWCHPQPMIYSPWCISWDDTLSVGYSTGLS